MNQILPTKLTQSEIKELMCSGRGVGAGECGIEFSPMSWLLMVEEAKGVGRVAFAEAMGVEVGDLQRLVEETVNQTGETAESLWQIGVVMIRASAMQAKAQIATGWDQIEAMAMEKLGEQLRTMTTPGDPKMMLDIAKTANAAIRRGMGEGRGGGGSAAISVKMSESGGEVEMASGDLGSMTLRFSPRIQEQLRQPGRVIEGASKEVSGRKMSTDSLQMVRLQEARDIAIVMDKQDAESELDRLHLESVARVEAESAAKKKAAGFGLGSIFGEPNLK